MTIPTKSFINFFSSHWYNSLSPISLVTWEGEGKPKIVTKGDKGGRGVKIFAVTSFLNGPLVLHSYPVLAPSDFVLFILLQFE